MERGSKEPAQLLQPTRLQNLSGYRYLRQSGGNIPVRLDLGVAVPEGVCGIIIFFSLIHLHHLGNSICFQSESLPTAHPNRGYLDVF